ncbi:MAG TPA: hypothetical protein VN962_20025 [Polyangia bacterium]|nr:hypothetical protein [Polyangia bacterium]
MAVVFVAACSSSLATPPGGTGGAGPAGSSGEGGVPATGGAPTGGTAGGNVGGTGGLAGAGGLTGTGGIAGAGGLTGAGGMAGAGGLTGTGGVAGGDGLAGTGGWTPSRGGTGGAPLPLCPAAGGAADGGVGGAGAGDVESCIYDADNKPVFTTVNAAVTVASIDQVPAGNCSFFKFPFATTSSPPSSKVVLETADHQRWTMYLRIPHMPADAIRIGDSFDLAVSGSTPFFASFSPPDQTISLGRSGHTVVFAYAGPGVSSLDFPVGIMIRDAGATCQDPPIYAQCYGFAHHVASVSFGADTAIVQEGETRTVGDLALTLSHDVAWQDSPAQCDGSSYTILGGFVAAP